MYKNKNYAKDFIKEYDVKKIDIYTLKTIISKLGYKLIEYNPLLSDDYTDTLVKGLDIEKKLKDKCCFTYKNKFISCIFVRENVPEYELIHMLLHEIGHIYIHHIDSSTTDKPDYYEYEANRFADDVKHYVSQNRIKRALYGAPVFLLSAAAITAIVLFVKQSRSDEYNYYQEMQETTTAITEIATEPTTETTTEEIAEENDDTLYYVSKSGKKYHLEDCNYIDVGECTELTLEEVEKLGYEPCKVCKPDKRS